MTRLTQWVVVSVVCVCAVGCSSKPSRREDNPGSEPRVTLKSFGEPGRYVGTTELSGSMKIVPNKGSQTTVPMFTRLETSLDISETAGRKQASAVFTRVKMKVMGIEADTNVPLPTPAKPSTPRGPGSFTRHSPSRKDPALEVRRALGEMIGPKIEWEITPEGQIGKILRNELSESIKNPQMAEALKQTMKPEDLAEAFCGKYPTTPVGVGAIWHMERTRNVPGCSVPVSVESEFELTELKDTPKGKIATMKYYGNLCKDINATTKGVTVRDIDLTSKGVILVNANTGLQLKNTSTITGTMNFKASGQSGKMNINWTLEYTAKAVQ